MRSKLKEWVEDACDTMDDGATLRTMRGIAFAKAAEALYLLSCLPADDDWVPQLEVERDEALDHIIRIEDRMTSLDMGAADRSRNYGLSLKDAMEVETLVTARRGGGTP